MSENIQIVVLGDLTALTSSFSPVWAKNVFALLARSM